MVRVWLVRGVDLFRRDGVTPGDGSTLEGELNFVKEGSDDLHYLDNRTKLLLSESFSRTPHFVDCRISSVANIAS